MRKILKSRESIKLLILTIVTALVVRFLLYILIFVGILLGSLIGEKPAVICTLCVLAAICFLPGVFAVDNVKSWAISLPIQFLICVAIQYVGSELFVPTHFIGKANFAIEMLACQALGVGIKTIYRKIKSKKSRS